MAEVARGTAEILQLANLRFDGIDFSEGMLDVARTKDIYSDLALADLTKPLEIQSMTYDAITSCGVFLQGHVGAECIPELARILVSGGFMCFSVRPTFYEETKDEWATSIESAGMAIVSIDLLPYKRVPEGQAPFLGYFLTCVKKS